MTDVELTTAFATAKQRGVLVMDRRGDARS